MKTSKTIIKKTITIFAVAMTLFCSTSSLVSCSKNDDDPLPIESPKLLEYSLIVESIANNESTTNKCFINLYDGILYNKAEALANSNKVDLAYNYGSNGRFFESVNGMSGRTGYVRNWSTITNSKIKAMLTTISALEFDNLKTNEDISNLFKTKSITIGTGDNFNNGVISGVNDLATSIVLAFTDKNSKTGFIKIGNYTANVPFEDKALLPIQIKISK